MFGACLAKIFFSFKSSCQNRPKDVFAKYAFKQKKRFIKILAKQIRPN
jgi:hypothetical protein